MPHRRLILKLKAYNIDSKNVRWIEQWLHMRSKTVVVDGQQKGQPSDIRCSAGHSVGSIAVPSRSSNSLVPSLYQ